MPIDIVILTSIAIFMLSVMGTGAIAFYTMRLGGKLNAVGILIVGSAIGSLLVALFLFNFVLGK